MRNHLLLLPRRRKQSIVVVLDLVLSVVATWVAFGLRLDMFWPQGYQWPVYALGPVVALPLFIRMGLYRAVFRYTGLEAMLYVSRALFLYGAIFFCIVFFAEWSNIPRSVGVMQPLLLLLLVAGSRIFARFWLRQAGALGRTRKNDHSKFLIYGAGQAGVQMGDVLMKKDDVSFVGFVDDDRQLIGKTINGQQVHSPLNIERLIDERGVTDVLLALGTVDKGRRREILARLSGLHVRIRVVPNLSDLAQGRITERDIHELDIGDLLGRDAVAPDMALFGRNIRGKVVLVTGAGGSIGSELCRQILSAEPAKLLLVEHGEFALYEIHADLKAHAAKAHISSEIVPLLGSVRDQDRLREIFKVWTPQTVYHAAAYKHVPLVEHNPAEGIRNNVFGTCNVALAAIEARTSDFVLISTDKAVRPTNIMGASKRLAEMILQALSQVEHLAFCHASKGWPRMSNQTKFSMVRFGNVLGSSGSVVPLFRQQIKAGGPITLTDKEVTRYFMTIPEAAQLVIQAAAMAEGGDVFVLDMGEPVKISDLAVRMVELSGLTIKSPANPSGDIEITVTGLRPGEKLYEELLIGENPQSTAHPRIMKAHEDFVGWDALEAELVRMQEATAVNDVETIRAILAKLVSGYRKAGATVDWIHLEEGEKAA